MIWYRTYYFFFLIIASIIIIISHYDDVIMGTIASLITRLTIVYSTVYSNADKRKHQSSTSLAFVWGIHRWPVNSPHKWPVTRKMFPFNDVIISIVHLSCQYDYNFYWYCYKFNFCLLSVNLRLSLSSLSQFSRSSLLLSSLTSVGSWLLNNVIIIIICGYEGSTPPKRDGFRLLAAST